MFHVIILTTDIDCLSTFLHCLPVSAKKKCFFHIVNDDRKFPLMDVIPQVVHPHRIKAEIYSGTSIVNKWMTELSMKEWFYYWKRSCKVFLPLEFSYLDKFLYIDDDVTILKDPQPLFEEYDFCASFKRVMGRFSPGPFFNFHKKVFPEVLDTVEEYNHSMLNSGTIIHKNTQAITAMYQQKLLAFYNSSFMEKTFLTGKSFGDEPFMTFWLKSCGVELLDGDILYTAQWDKFVFKQIWENPPFTFHYPVGDTVMPIYWDYFKSLRRVRGDETILYSRYGTKLEFENRVDKSQPKLRKELTKSEWRLQKMLFEELRRTNARRK